MACFNPSLAYIFKADSHECRKVRLYKVKDYNKPLDYSLIGNLDYNWNSKEFGRVHGVLEDLVLVPCGNCEACALDHAKIWQMRLSCEDASSVNSYFLTLTYNDENLPSNYQLKKDDLQKFIRSLKDFLSDRFNFNGLRYYACGEYGGKTGRPHYHMIIFNCPVLTLDFKNFFGKDFMVEKHNVGKSFNGVDIFHVNWIDKLWNKGFVSIAPTSSKVFGYVARYCNKKRCLTRDEKVILNRKGIQTEFNFMSLRPGIGAVFYYDKMQDILNNNGCFSLNGINYTVDRYFYKLCEKNEIDVKSIKDYKKEIANLKINSSVVDFDNDFNLMYFKNKDKLLSKVKLLKRGL